MEMAISCRHTSFFRWMCARWVLYPCGSSCPPVIHTASGVVSHGSITTRRVAKLMRSVLVRVGLIRQSAPSTPPPRVSHRKHAYPFPPCYNSYPLRGKRPLKSRCWYRRPYFPRSADARHWRATRAYCRRCCWAAAARVHWRRGTPSRFSPTRQRSRPTWCRRLAGRKGGWGRKDGGMDITGDAETCCGRVGVKGVGAPGVRRLSCCTSLTTQTHLVVYSVPCCVHGVCFDVW